MLAPLLMTKGLVLCNSTLREQVQRKKWHFSLLIFNQTPSRSLSFSVNFYLHPACVLLSVCSLHFTLSLRFTPSPQSAVCSPQSAFYPDRFSLIKVNDAATDK